MFTNMESVQIIIHTTVCLSDNMESVQIIIHTTSMFIW